MSDEYPKAVIFIISGIHHALISYYLLDILPLPAADNDICRNYVIYFSPFIWMRAIKKLC